MQIETIKDIIEATVLQGEEFLSDEVNKAFSSDLMSDVLTLDTDNLLLITGLNNLQTIRTAEMAEIKYILFVRNKKLSAEMIALAKKEKMVLMVSEKSLFRVSGMLFKAGLEPVY
jgi:predicted transcriptional regulator